MRHSKFDFTPDRKNIQTIKKRKTKEYYTKIQKLEFSIILHECSSICKKGEK